MTLKTPSKVEVTDNFSDPAFADKDHLEFTDCLCSMSVFSYWPHEIFNLLWRRQGKMRNMFMTHDIKISSETYMLFARLTKRH